MFRSAIVLLLLAVLLLGCGNDPEDNIVGVWGADAEASSVPAIPIPAMERQVKSFLGNFVLKLRSDKTFVFTTGASVKGTWTLEGKNLILKVDEGSFKGPFGNMLSDLDGTLNDDYSKLTVEQPTPVGPLTIVLRKKA